MHALLREGVCDCQTNTNAAAGNHCDLAREFEIHSFKHRCINESLTNQGIALLRVDSFIRLFGGSFGADSIR